MPSADDGCSWFESHSWAAVTSQLLVATLVSAAYRIFRSTAFGTVIDWSLMSTTSNASM